MKTLKTLFMLLLMTLSMAVSAQTIVAVEKTDGTTDNYNLADVDSVVYEPKAEVKYYYYAGWTCPKNLTELATAVTEQYPVSSTNTTMHYAGGIADMTKTYTKENPLKYYGDNLYYSTAKTNYYLVLPEGIGVYGSDGANSLLDTFTLVDTFDNHNVYKSNGTTRNIAGLMLY